MNVLEVEGKGKECLFPDTSENAKLLAVVEYGKSFELVIKTITHVPMFPRSSAISFIKLR